MIEILNTFAAATSTCAKGSVQAANSIANSLVGCQPTGLPTVGAGSNQLSNILALVFATLAAISVLMIIIGGFRLVISNGDPQNISTAKNTIIFSVIGLVIALTAEAIVSFTLGYL